MKSNIFIMTPKLVKDALNSVLSDLKLRSWLIRESEPYIPGRARGDMLISKA